MDGKEITDALSKVNDSYFNKDLITLGYIKGMSIGDKELRFTLRLPAPLMPNHEELAQKCREALKDVKGLETIEIKKDWEVQRLPALNQPNTPQALKNVKNIIAIASGKGGVGKSTVTVCIAEAFACLGFISSYIVRGHMNTSKTRNACKTRTLQLCVSGHSYLC